MFMAAATTTNPEHFHLFLGIEHWELFNLHSCGFLHWPAFKLSGIVTRPDAALRTLLTFSQASQTAFALPVRTEHLGKLTVVKPHPDLTVHLCLEDEDEKVLRLMEATIDGFGFVLNRGNLFKEELVPC
jgi:hypothetical protein